MQTATSPNPRALDFEYKVLNYDEAPLEKLATAGFSA